MLGSLGQALTPGRGQVRPPDPTINSVAGPHDQTPGDELIDHTGRPRAISQEQLRDVGQGRGWRRIRLDETQDPVVRRRHQLG